MHALSLTSTNEENVLSRGRSKRSSPSAASHWSIQCPTDIPWAGLQRTGRSHCPSLVTACLLWEPGGLALTLPLCYPSSLAQCQQSPADSWFGSAIEVTHIRTDIACCCPIRGDSNHEKTFFIVPFISHIYYCANLIIQRTEMLTVHVLWPQWSSLFLPK